MSQSQLNAPLLGHAPLYNTVVCAGVRYWWQHSTRDGYLASKQSRRKVWHITFPCYFVLWFLFDASSGSTLSFLGLDIVTAAVVCAIVRWRPMASLWTDTLIMLAVIVPCSVYIICLPSSQHVRTGSSISSVEDHNHFVMLTVWTAVGISMLLGVHFTVAAGAGILLVIERLVFVSARVLSWDISCWLVIVLLGISIECVASEAYWSRSVIQSLLDNGSDGFCDICLSSGCISGVGGNAHLSFQGINLLGRHMVSLLHNNDRDRFELFIQKSAAGYFSTIWATFELFDTMKAFECRIVSYEASGTHVSLCFFFQGEVRMLVANSSSTHDSGLIVGVDHPDAREDSLILSVTEDSFASQRPSEPISFISEEPQGTRAKTTASSIDLATSVSSDSGTSCTPCFETDRQSSEAAASRGGEEANMTSTVALSEESEEDDMLDDKPSLRASSPSQDRVETDFARVDMATGRGLPPLPPGERPAARKVKHCSKKRKTLTMPEFLETPSDVLTQKMFNLANTISVRSSGCCFFHASVKHLIKHGKLILATVPCFELQKCNRLQCADCFHIQGVMQLGKGFDCDDCGSEEALPVRPSDRQAGSQAMSSDSDTIVEHERKL